MDLEDIRVTLNRLVSHLIEGIERIAHVYTLPNNGHSGLLECSLGGDKLTDWLVADRMTSSPQARCDASPMPSVPRGKSDVEPIHNTTVHDGCVPHVRGYFKFPVNCQGSPGRRGACGILLVREGRSVCNDPSYFPIASSVDVEPIYKTTSHNKCTPRFSRYFEFPLDCQDSPLCLPDSISPPLCDTQLPDPSYVQTASKDPGSGTHVTPPSYVNTTTSIQTNASRKGCIPQDGLVNLLDHKLSTAEVSLLKKGLSFVPTPLKITMLNYEKSLSKLRERDTRIDSAYPLEQKD